MATVIILKYSYQKGRRKAFFRKGILLFPFYGKKKLGSVWDFHNEKGIWVLKTEFHYTDRIGKVGERRENKYSGSWSVDETTN